MRERAAGNISHRVIREHAVEDQISRRAHRRISSVDYFFALALSRAREQAVEHDETAPAP